MRNTTKLLTFIPVLILLMTSTFFVRGETPLPQSDWYAVIWNRADDTLNWVNNETEFASIPRPHLPGESSGANLYISPNGRWMVLSALLENQREGLGFYDLQTGIWVQIHQTQPGESIIRAERNPFTRNSEYVAIGFSSANSWRVISFETATGNPIEQLTNEHPNITPNLISVHAAPRVTLYSLDEGLGQWRVHIRFMTPGPYQLPTPQPSLIWYPQQDIISSDNFDPLLLDLDILPIQGRILYSVRDVNNPTQTRIYAQTLGHEGELVYELNGAFINKPRWVYGGQLVAYHVTHGAQVPMWYIGSYGQNNLTPFAPDYDELLGTVDGFVLIDYEGGEVRFSNTLPEDAFMPTAGSVIYTTETSHFQIVYITPMGTQFTLSDLANPNSEPPVDVPNNIDTPALPCETAPDIRLEVGKAARTILPLNLRTAAYGSVVMQIAADTVVNVIGGPVCSENLYWWNIQFEAQGTITGGWAAEGDNQDYYLEPYTAPPADVDPIPTATIIPQVTLLVAVTPTPNLEIASPVLVTPTADLQVAPPAVSTIVPAGDGDCSSAPAGVQLSVGESAHTVTAGTLAMRTNLYDQSPSNNLPGNRTVTVLNGPVCNGGFRMWYVSTALNGSTVQGWVADGFGSHRYLRPGPARAS